MITIKNIEEILTLVLDNLITEITLRHIPKFIFIDKFTKTSSQIGMVKGR